MKRIAFLLAALALALSLCACAKQAEPERWDYKPCVMIDGVLYGTTGHRASYKTAERPENGGHTDGQITTSVPGYELPAQNDQSNFGDGYYYRFGEEEDTVEIFMPDPGGWYIYRAEPEN